MSAKQLEMDKRAYIAYLSYLICKKKEGIVAENQIRIYDEIEEVEKHIDNLDVMIMRNENEAINSQY